MSRTEIWSVKDTSLPEIYTAVQNLRARAGHDAIRTSVMTLVVVAANERAAIRAKEAMTNLGVRHPGRTIILSCHPKMVTELDAEVSLCEADSDMKKLWWDEIFISVGKNTCEHIGSVVEPLLLPDLPIAIWFTPIPPPSDHPLIDMANTVIVDGIGHKQELAGIEPPLAGVVPADQLDMLVQLCRAKPVLDLSWIAWSHLRELVASLFDPPEVRKFVKHIQSASVEAPHPSALLLAGWLWDRLNLELNSIHVADAPEAVVVLESMYAGQSAQFKVTSDPSGHELYGEVRVRGQQVISDKVYFPPQSLSWTLTKALSLSDHDRIYERALIQARDLSVAMGRVWGTFTGAQRNQAAYTSS